MPFEGQFIIDHIHNEISHISWHFLSIFKQGVIQIIVKSVKRDKVLSNYNTRVAMKECNHEYIIYIHQHVNNEALTSFLFISLKHNILTWEDGQFGYTPVTSIPL